MAWNAQKARRLIIVLYLIALHLVLGYFVGKELFGRYFQDAPLSVADPTEKQAVPTPIPVPSTLADLDGSGEHTLALDGREHSLDLIIPVAGVRIDQLIDSYKDERGDGRHHDAIDIPAPAGTPVIAATDGVIARFFDSEPGGITIYQWSRDRRYILYYAHLQKRADDIKVGDQVVRGKTIGYVGDTGNAGPGNFHLHFSISVVRDPDRYWEGDYLNPFPLLRKSNP